MVKKLTKKAWMSTGFLLLGCLLMAGVLLWKYAPSAFLALQGLTPILDESLGNIYGLSAIGLFILLVALFIFFKQLANPVSKKVDRFLEKHPEVTMAQLDHGFDVARKIDDIWVGDPWTFSHEFKNIVVENKEIVRIHSEKERSKRQTNYYLCMELADGAKERVLMGYHNLSEAIEMYRKYDHIRVEHNV